ncbi:MAG: hypothetical protein WKH68_09735, partial [Candidatus Limnocylindria bacterium]
MTARRNRIGEATRRALQQSGRQLTTNGTTGWPADCPTPRWQLCSRQLIGALEGGHLEGIGVL